MSQLKNRN